MGALRIGRSALALVALVSCLATVVIIHSAVRRTPAQTAALVALAQRRQLTAQAPVTSAPAAPAAPAASSTPAGGDSTGDNSAGESSSSSSAGDSIGDSGDTGGDTSGGSGDDGSSGGSGDNTSTNTGAAPSPDAGLPSVGHVFLLTLSAPGYADAFSQGSDAPYLRSLVRKGVLLSHFNSLGHGELADELAMVSGQAPNADTSAGCPTFREYPATASADTQGLVAGKGCVYPDSALTLGDQVTSDGKVWGAYIDAMGKTTCQHPNSNASTGLALPGTGPGYDVAHNPFVFFHSLLDAGDCFNDDHDLGKLAPALSSASRTPRFTFVAPDACADGDPVTVQPAAGTGTTTGTTTTGTTTTGTTTAGATSAGATTTASGTATTITTASSATPSATVSGTATATTTSTGTTTSTTSTSSSPAAAGCPAGQPSGLQAEDAFLKQWTPAITRSAAYRHDGVLVIAFAGTRSTGHPVRTGALVLSPHTHANTTVATAYTPYSLLRSIEDMLNDAPLAHATKAPSFAKAVLGVS